MRDATLDQLAHALATSTTNLPFATALQCAAAAWDVAERIHASGDKVQDDVLADALAPVVLDAMPTLPASLRADRAQAMARVIAKRFVPSTNPGPAPAPPHRAKWRDVLGIPQPDGWRLRHAPKPDTTRT